MNRLLTGIRPTGELHLGNLLGAFNVLRTWEGESFIFIGDLHGHVTGFCSRKQILDKAREILAVVRTFQLKGCHVFIQSHNPDHLTLSWMLGCLTPLGQLRTMWAYKEKSKGGKGNLALLGYPVLMAADIMLYSPCLVPVGLDQRQHIEFYSKLASKVNQVWSRDISIKTLEHEVKVMDLRDPEIKMSKSSKSKLGVINMTDSLEELRRKVWRAQTSTLNVGEDQSAGTLNLLQITAYLTKSSVEQVRLKVMNHEDLKKKLYTCLSELVLTFQENHRELLQLSDVEVLNILNRGLVNARRLSRDFLKQFSDVLIK